jgi:hypothetical protein
MSDDFLGGESLPAVKFPEVGVTYKMQVLDVSKIQDRKPDGTPQTWDDGNPKYVHPTTVVVDGEKMTLWVRGNLLKQIREACRGVGIRSLPGTWLTIRREADGEARKGFAAPHLFKVKAEPGVLAPEPVADPFTDDDSPF